MVSPMTGILTHVTFQWHLMVSFSPTRKNPGSEPTTARFAAYKADHAYPVPQSCCASAHNVIPGAVATTWVGATCCAATAGGRATELRGMGDLNGFAVTL